MLKSNLASLPKSPPSSKAKPLNLQKMSDYELLSILAQDTDHLTEREYEGYLDIEEMVAVLGQRLYPSARAKLIRLIQRGAKSDAS